MNEPEVKVGVYLKSLPQIAGYLLEGADRCKPRQPCMSCYTVVSIDQS